MKLQLGWCLFLSVCQAAVTPSKDSDEHADYDILHALNGGGINDGTILAGSVLGAVGAIVGTRDNPSTMSVLENAGIGAAAGLAVNAVLRRYGSNPDDEFFGRDDLLSSTQYPAIQPLLPGMKVEVIGDPTVGLFLDHYRTLSESKALHFRSDGSLGLNEGFSLVVIGPVFSERFVFGQLGHVAVVSEGNTERSMELANLLLQLKTENPKRVFWILHRDDFTAKPDTSQLSSERAHIHRRFLREGLIALVMGDALFVASAIDNMAITAPVPGVLLHAPTVHAWATAIDHWKLSNVSALGPKQVQWDSDGGPHVLLEHANAAHADTKVSAWLKTNGITRMFVGHNSRTNMHMVAEEEHLVVACSLHSVPVEKSVAHYAQRAVVTVGDTQVYDRHDPKKGETVTSYPSHII